MVTLKHAFAFGQHHFLLERGTTAEGTPAGCWASYTPPTAEGPGVVMMLYATKESRIYATHVLGALALHSIDTYGELPVGSHDVSKYSIKLQQRLSKILGQLPASAVMNNEDWESSLRNVAHMSQVFKAVKYDDITYDIAIGKDFVLDVVQGRLPV